MERYEYLARTKDELKVLAAEIRSLKPQKKLKNRGTRHLADIMWEIWKAQYQFRHKHIAYCLIRGTEREKIEEPKAHNMPNEGFVTELLADYEKTVCISQD